MTRFIAMAGLLAALVGLTGCSEKKVGVRGTVTRGGEKLTWPEGGSLLVVFCPVDYKRDQRVYSAQTDTATSTYQIVAIPPGRYQVAVQQFDEGYMDALGGVYDPGSSPLVYEVNLDGQVIDIELPKALPKRIPFREDGN
ncbi:MAG TPA: hypothetical protein VKE74_32505 [Gemmataceae bacterium]|nr:hypothetical protein [Gemmataceae bacterium]